MSVSNSATGAVVRTLLLTDLVDSTRLIERIGDGRASEVLAQSDRIARDLLIRFNGTEIDKTDGFLFLFERPIDAVRYALAYHTALAGLESEVDASISARAGIHLGEVVLRTNLPEDVALGAKPVEVDGLAKHTAARAMSLAGAKQTLLTRAAFDLARRASVGEIALDKELQWLVHERYRFKGVSEPIEIFEVGMAGFAPLTAPADSEKAGRALTPAEEAKEAGRSIAVLPFRDMSPGRDQGYFCEGIAEEIINALTQVEGLHVASRGSSSQFDPPYDVREVGHKLKVAQVTEGSLRRAGKRIRITAQLTNTSDGYQVWSERFDRIDEDIFEIQDEISMGILKKMKLELAGDKGHVRRYTDNIEAYNLYLKGRYYWNHRVPDAIRKSIEVYKQALDLDPNYALAYCGLADCYLVPAYCGTQLPGQVVPLAKAAAERALTIDPNLVEAHTSLGMIACIYDNDWERAERHFGLAIENNPNYAVARMWHALFFLVPVGRRVEAVDEARRAQQLDPITSTINVIVGACLFFNGQYDSAVEELERALDTDSTAVIGYYFLGRAYWECGLHDKSVEAMQTAMSLYNMPLVNGHLGYCNATLGACRE